ncbi:hypothetical protein AGMMS49983_14220 [Clostridia bacterium]|nr:hypothetical protein AGMMS49983_14220 [Clostridia bacterium]
MENNVHLPKMGLTMTAAKIVEWLKAEGDTITAGEELYSMETEKLTEIIESPFSGVVKKILVEAGEEVDCGTLVAVIES